MFAVFFCKSLFYLCILTFISTINESIHSEYCWIFFFFQRSTALFPRSKCQTDVKMTCLQATTWFLFMFHQPLKTSQRCSAVRTYKAFLFSPRRLCIVHFPGLRFKYICNSCGHFAFYYFLLLMNFSCLKSFDFSFIKSSTCPK